MVDLNAVRNRYLKDARAVRLGGLAANLARASACVGKVTNDQAVIGILQESMWFIEWTVPDFIVDEIETAAELVTLQLQLSMWQID